MDSRTLAEYLAQKTFEKKAENVVILDLGHKSPVADYYVICSGFSDRQVAAVAEHLSSTMRAEGVRPYHQEGMADGRWALLDFGSVIVHVFQDHLRDHYNLEALWSEAPRIRVRERNVSSLSSFHSSMQGGSEHAAL